MANQILAQRRRSAEHGVEKVGEKLRAMMPWIAENALVDKAKKLIATGYLPNLVSTRKF